MGFALTWGFDRALGYAVPLSPYGSGGTGVVGTAPPAGSVLITDVNGNSITLQEDTDSPTIERGVQCTAKHSFTMSYSAAINLLDYLPMGTILEDSNGNIWRLLTANVQSEVGTQAKLITVSESVSFDTPPDEFQINSVDLGIDIIKHPRYFPNLYPTADEMGTLIGQVKEAIIRAIQTYRDSPFFPATSQLTQFLNGQVQNGICSTLVNGQQVVTLPNINFNPLFPVVYQYTTDPDTYIQDGNSINFVPAYPDKATVPLLQVNDPSVYVSVDNITIDNDSIALAYAAAQEIITKLWRQEDSPYLSGIEIKWSQFFFLPPIFNMGSYLQDPTLIVPDYFLQPDRPLTELPPRGGVLPSPPLGDNVFDQNAIINPQDFSDDGTILGITQISWLRKSDEVQWDRGLCKITYSWVGSAIGYFDTDIYGATVRPSTPEEYTTFS